MGLAGALAYVLWVSKFQSKYQKGTQRSVGQFQRFQESLRHSQARDLEAAANPRPTEVIKPDPEPRA